MKRAFPSAAIAVLFFGAFPLCAAELTAARLDGRIVVQGEHFRVTVDAARGGEISEIALFDGAQWHSVLGGDGQTCPAVEFNDGEAEFALNRCSARIEAFQAEPDVVHLRAVGVPQSPDGKPSPWSVTLDYEIYAEGGVFIESEVSLPEKPATLADATVSLRLDGAACTAPKYRQSDQPRIAATLPAARVALGFSPERSYTNEIAVMVERNEPLAGKTGFSMEKGRFTWRLADGSNRLTPGFRYANRFSMALGAAATGKPKTNLVGSRVYHWINYLDRKATEAWFPTADQIDRMAANGATMLILHQDWMLQSGSNGKPHAEYDVIRHEGALRRTIERAHEKGLRVGLYRRGIERYSLDAPYFNEYCRPNWDGFYVDWHGPHCIALHEKNCAPETALGDAHFSTGGTVLPAYDYFRFTKELRKIVGPNGFLIGHMGFGNAGILPNLSFDGYLPGETPSDHKMLSSDVDHAVFAGMTAGGLCTPWTLDAPEYTTPEGVAKMAAWGFYPQVGLGLQRNRDATLFPLDPDAEANRFALPYWRVLSAVDAEKCRVFNLPSENLPAIRWSKAEFGGVVYRESGDGPDTFLLVAVNLGSTPASAEAELLADVLGLEGKYTVTHIDAATGNAVPRGTTTGTIRTSELPQWGFEGIKLSKP